MKPTRAVPESRQGAFHSGLHGAWMGNWAFNRVGSESGTESSPTAHEVHQLTPEQEQQVQQA